MTRAPLLCVFIAAAACSRSTELIATSSSLQCANNNAPIHLGGTDSAHCAGALAAQFGRYALCTCADLSVVADLAVHDPPSKSPPPQPASGGGASGHSSVSAPTQDKATDPQPGAIGVAGDMTVWKTTKLNGTIVVSGTDGIKLEGGNIGGNMHSGGDIDTLAPASVGGDMYAAGDIMGPYSISGTLHLPDSSTIGTTTVAPSVTHESVSVPTPCGCDKAPSFDIAGEVSARANNNANNAVSFTDELAGEVSDSSTFDWPCGEYYLPGLQTSQGASVTFRIHGHVAIFVDGDVQLGDDLSVTFDEGADLDLVVAGSFYTLGGLFGAPMSPAALRLWIASTTISLDNQIQFGAVVYAPSAVFTAGVGLTMNGSYLVQTLTAKDDVSIFYDPNAAQSGQVCGVAPPDPVR